MKQTEILTHATHVNGWEPAVYMSCMSQNFGLFHVSNLSVRNFRIFLPMYTGSLAACLSHSFTAHRRQDCRNRPLPHQTDLHWLHDVYDPDVYFRFIAKASLYRARISPLVVHCRLLGGGRTEIAPPFAQERMRFVASDGSAHAKSHIRSGCFSRARACLFAASGFLGVPSRHTEYSWIHGRFHFPGTAVGGTTKGES